MTLLALMDRDEVRAAASTNPCSLTSDELVLETMVLMRYKRQ